MKDCKNCMNCQYLRGFMAECFYERHYNAEDGTPMVCYTNQVINRKNAEKCEYYDEIILSHSEAEIYKGCVALMQELVDDFMEWYKWQNGEDAIEELDEEEMFCVRKTPFHIVQRLFLWGTHHSGGGSTRSKCSQLGIKDWSEDIEFGFEIEESEG